MPASSSSPAGHAPAGLAPFCPFDRDDPRYWDARPSDHGWNGLYLDGPQPGVDPIVKLAGTVTASAVTEREKAAADAEERRAMRQALPAPALPTPHATLWAAVNGKRHRVKRAA